ncbi:MAG: NAD(P)-dependent glycerol-3-phosphate dehydrogenase [Alphaproteobacteria bacterium]|nr:NAD(P)-dependent glycerol-3-phosphate dehydrogenase [Alphaproteobacteria bacterium]
MALVAARAGRDVVLWARNPDHAARMARDRTNARYLPDIPLPPAIRPTAERGDLHACDAVLLVTPAQTVRAVARAFAGVLGADCPLVVCAKGIEFQTGALMSEVLAAELPGRCYAVLSGPTFAREVARGLPTAVTLACESLATATDLAESLASPAFRPYASGDLIGVEVAGALKNVIAIACGVVKGRALGENARASLITRGLAELQRLAVAKGGLAQSMMGLGGVGDLTLTCSTEQSRNFHFGVLIGRGLPVADALARPDVVVEGVHTARAVPGLAQALGVDLPICQAVADVLHAGCPIDRAIADLLARPLRREEA